MQRRDGSGQPAKEQRKSRPKARKAPTAHVSNADLQEQLGRAIRERDEALERQAATSEVLQVISSSSGKLEPVFQAMLDNALRICEAKFGTLFRFDGKAFHRAAGIGVPSALAEFQKRRGPYLPESGTLLDRVLQTRKVAHSPDYAAEPVPGNAAKLGGARSTVAVPMLKDSELVGAIIIYRREVRPFTDKQIDLVKNFAAQAVIAIENARLLGELRESLQQQTATADVLKVISRSTFNLQVVLDTLVESAAMLCQADKARILRPTGKDESYYVQARTREPSSAEYDEHIKTLRFAPGRGGVVSRVLMEGKSVHIPDVLADPEYTLQKSARLAGYRTSLGVPLLREGSPIGLLVLQRASVRPYTDKEIELAETFADQAVIAIENVRLFDEVQARTRELSEALEQQTATSEVLQIISSSQGDLEPVFNAMLGNATRICEAKFGVLFLYEGDAFRVMALHGAPPAFAELRRRDPRIGIPQGTALARIVETRQTVQVADVQSEPAYSNDPQRRAGIIGIAGARTLILVPMLKDGELVGAISMYRQEVRPFTDKQIELVTNFASQAVIAIENARLLNELRQRTDDLSESLEQQTATSEVLQVISSSRGELEPVFDAMLANATRICEAKFGTLYLRDGDGFHAVAATRDAPPAYVEARKRELRIQPSQDGPLGCAAITKQVAHVADMMELQSYRDGSHPQIVEAVELGKFRTALGVPMLKDDELIGVITILRQEVRPFTEKQIELVQNFAAQAVIAIENTRLLNELRESLQQQTATADVLKVISRSTFDLRTVLQTLVESAARLCDADKGNITREKDGVFYRAAASYGYSRQFMDHIKGIPLKPDRGSATGRALLEGRTIHIPDVMTDPEYTLSEAQRLGDYRTILCVPMLREGVALGVLTLTRSEVRPFSDKQIELVTTFADQAAIAIENVRLFESVETRTRELSESLEQQTATSEILASISGSLTDTKPVFDAIVRNLLRLFGTSFAVVQLLKDRTVHMAALDGAPGFERLFERYPRPLDDATGGGRAMLTRQVYQISPVLGNSAAPRAMQDFAREFNFNSAIFAPMIRGDNVIGAIGVADFGPRVFDDKQVALIKAFADQAVIAIENARLFEELQKRTDDLSTSLDDLRTTQDRLVQTQKLASLGQLTAGIAHEIKNPLNFVNNFSGLSGEMIEELREALADVNLTEKKRSEITELMDTLRGNFDKVVQHGKRADVIVKNMLLHSREGSGEHRRVDINALVEESLNLAWHGARAEKQGFDVTMKRSFDPTAGEADLFPQDITRALLNLISNGFYAATKRRAETNGGYEPSLAAATRNLGDRVEITIRDNGTGIPLDVKEKMFNPFFTTKPAGEGTGLGLSISHDIIVKQHGGSIEVDTQPGEFTEIRVILPRVTALLPERS